MSASQFSSLPPDIQVLIKSAYFLCSKATAVRGGEEREIIAYRVPVREFERLRAKSERVQAALKVSAQEGGAQ